nr:TetR/AcrR family transcriptional regulator [Kibdelosporangium sp. MJ126-NF4]
MPSVTRPSRSTRKERRDAMEQRVIAAAEQLVTDGESFTELSVERLAAVAGISRSTFYVHFEDKGDLARRATRAVAAEVEEVSDTWWSVAHLANQDQLRTALSALIDLYRRRGAAFTMMSEAGTYDTGVAEEVGSLMKRLIDTTRQAIERGLAAGVMRPVEPKETAAVLTWMVERVGYQLLRQTDPSGHDKVADVLADIIWSTLYKN